MQYLPTRVWTLNFDLSYTETESVTNLIPILTTPSATPGPGGFTLTPTPTPTSPTTPTTPTGPATPPPTGTQAPVAGTSPTAATPNISPLEFGRQKATLLYISPTVQYQFSPATSAIAGYSYTFSTLELGANNTDHRIFSGLSHQFTPLDTGRIRYSFDIFESTDSDNVTSQRRHPRMDSPADADHDRELGHRPSVHRGQRQS